MTKSFDFLFDVGGPNGYLVHKVLPEFCAAHGAEVRYIPVLLGGLFKATGNSAPSMRYADAPAKWAYEQLEFQRFVAKHAIPFAPNPHFPMNTLLVMRGCIAAQREGVFIPYLDAVMEAMWVQGQNIGDRDVIVTALNAAGLDGARLIALTDDPDVKVELIANTEAAVARGAFGIPTFFAGEEMFWGKERLDQLAAALD